MGLFSAIFGKKEKLLEPADLSVLHTDVHSHLIPAIDDGSNSLEESIEMLQKFSELGYKKVITTPHIMSDFYKNSAETILPGLELLRHEIARQGLKIEIEAAAEYQLEPEFETKLEKETLLTFGDNYLLFELPFFSEPPSLSRAVFQMQAKGYKPVLAHVERYSFWHNDPGKVEELIERGVIMQININSLSGHYGPEVKKFSEDCIDRGWVGFLGSDCHRIEHLVLLDETRKRPYFHKALQLPLLNKTL